MNDNVSISGEEKTPNLEKANISKFSDEILFTNFTVDSYLDDSLSTLSNSSLEDIQENNKRIFREFSLKETPKLIAIIEEQEFEYGFESPAERFIKEKLRVNSFVAKEWLNKLFLQMFDNAHIIIGILQAISHLNYSEIFPTGQTMALAALSHKNAEVRECGIRAFESWCNYESLKVLKTVHYPEKWLQDYVNQVIKDIEEELQ
ncbi:MAG TPA: hypothetical protein ENG40_01490 [Thermoprotei archaeon]|nr:hypothetical protein [Thermoprotei archaeon]